MVRPPSGRWTSSSCRWCAAATGVLLPEPGQWRDLVGRVVAQRVGVGERRRQASGERSRLEHLEPDAPQSRRLRARSRGAGRRRHRWRRRRGQPPSGCPSCRRGRGARPPRRGGPGGSDSGPVPAPSGARAARRGRGGARRRRPARSAARPRCRPAPPGCRPAPRPARGTDTPRAAASGCRANASMTARSSAVQATVSEPVGRNPTPGTAAPISSQRRRARSATSSSAPERRPLTHTSPKLRTEAPVGAASASRWSTVKPASTSSRACQVPRMPPPATTARAPVRLIARSASRVGVARVRRAIWCSLALALALAGRRHPAALHRAASAARTDARMASAASQGRVVPEDGAARHEDVRTGGRGDRAPS